MHWGKLRRGIGELTGKLAIIAVVGSVCVTGSAATALAAVSYGPPPVKIVLPLGFSVVIDSQTITAKGGVIGPINVDGTIVTLSIPRFAFPFPVQITVTAPAEALTALPGIPGYKIVAAVGIQVQVNGSAYRGDFAKPITLTMSLPSIHPPDVVAVWNGTAFATDRSASVGAGTIRVTFDSDPDFAVFSPVQVTGPIRGATGSVTGMPVAGLAILAGVLVLTGMCGLALSRRRRVNS